MRTCVVLIGVFAACGVEKNDSAAETEPSPTLAETRIAVERAPPTRPEEPKQQTWPRTRCDPPADLPHLASTTPELRHRIDALIATMIDVEAGRDALRARDALGACGKPAFPRVLGAMARIRDTITDDDTAEERRIESSLRIAEQALRQLDGYLDARDMPTVRPGTDKRYIIYICRLHYKRWTETLRYMDELPGPYDPAALQESVITMSLRFWIGDERNRRPWANRTANAQSTLQGLFDSRGSMLLLLSERAWTLIGEVPARMKEESREELGPLLVRGLDHADPRLRTLAVSCLRVLYGVSLGYDPKAPPARREDKIRRWRQMVEKAR